MINALHSLIKKQFGSQNKKRLAIKKDNKGLVQVQVVESFGVTNSEDLGKLYNRGLEAFKKSGCDPTSTHIVTSFVIESDNKESGSNIRGRLSFYDMAGCEKYAIFHNAGQ